MSEHITHETETVAKVLLNTKGINTMKKLVRGLFTEGEIEELSRRIEIVKMIKKGIPHHKIALALGVGVATVTRGAKEVKLNRFKTV